MYVSEIVSISASMMLLLCLINALHVVSFVKLYIIKNLKSGPSCSKLTTSLMNDSLKFISSDTQIF